MFGTSNFDISYPDFSKSLDNYSIKSSIDNFASKSNKILVRGNIFDENNEALMGATVLDLSDNTNGATTNFVGEFEIEVEPTAKLKVQYMGFESKTFVAQDFPDQLQLVEAVDNLDTVWIAQTPKKDENESKYSDLLTWVLGLIAVLTFFKK